MQSFFWVITNSKRDNACNTVSMSGSVFDHSHQHFSSSKNITFWKNFQDHTLVIVQCHAFLKASLETKQVSKERIPLLERGEERVGGKKKGDKGQWRRE